MSVASFLQYCQQLSGEFWHLSFLGIGRAIGETMAVIMVAGNQAVLPDSLISGVRTMTTNIVMEMGYSSGLHREALIGTAVVLFIFVLIINISFSLLHKEE